MSDDVICLPGNLCSNEHQHTNPLQTAFQQVIVTLPWRSSGLHANTHINAILRNALSVKES